MVIVVNYWMGLPKAKQPREGNKSYSRLKTAISDPFLKTKFKFFAATTKFLNSFLVKFQTNNPIVPFLAQAIEEIMRLFGSSFLLKETLSKASTCIRLSKLNFNDPSLHKRPGDADPGIGIKLELSVLTKNGEINFRRDVVSFLSKICTHQCCPHIETSQLIRCANQLTGFYMRATLASSSHQSNSDFLEILDALSSPVCWLKILNLAKQDFFMCWKTLLLLNKSQMDLQNKLNNSFQSFWKLPKKTSGVLLNFIRQNKVTALILSTENILNVSAQLKTLPRF